MPLRKRYALASLLLALSLAACSGDPANVAATATAPAATSAATASSRWIGTWGASPFSFQAFGPAPPPQPFVNQTVREKLRISVGGSQVRVRFSNELGTTPLVIGAATIALADNAAPLPPASAPTRNPARRP